MFLGMNSSRAAVTVSKIHFIIGVLSWSNFLALIYYLFLTSAIMKIYSPFKPKYILLTLSVESITAVTVASQFELLPYQVGLVDLRGDALFILKLARTFSNLFKDLL